MGKEKSIVILGAGYGGVHAAKRLNRKLGSRDVSITLIDRKPYHTLMTELHEVAGERVEPDSVQVRLSKIFAGSKVKVVNDFVQKIDFEKQSLVSKDTSYHYDYLIIGSGAEPAFFGVEGVRENGFTIWSMEDALKIKHHIIEMFEKASIERDAKKRKALLTFVVAGAGFTGIETVGELAEWKHRLCEEHEIDQREVRLLVVEAMCSILPILSEKLIKRSERYLKSMGIEVIVDAPIIKVDKDNVTLKNGDVIDSNTLIWTCGVQGSEFGASLGLTMGKRNRVQVNEYMQSVDYPNVYLVGDNMYFEENGKPLPQIVETAIQTGETAAENITADILGREKKPFKSNYHGIMVSIGSRNAVSNVMNMETRGFAAMGTKHLVNLHYLWGVGGFRQCVSYIMHEFFDVKDRRSMLGGHLSARTPILWLAVLRVYLGFIWLFEGIKKIREGWFDPTKNFVVTMPNADQLPQQTADAVTNATQVTQYWPEPLLKRPPVIYEWFMDTVIAPNAYLFQVVLVLTEIAIGLALIAGLLTVLASIGSLFLCANFILSAMAGSEILWHIFAGIAMFGGAGRAFGLDYYVMPWLKNWWKNTRFARRTYLYTD
ncbi:MAG: FAD-dependent pyridine nucleotide-disulfide oxidoreductase [Clostridia bacterium]|jgi:NADH dehydrogenase|nr:FAD-dependent pyridine nucleotide-disulfide oxidoreductase [Clostridia bacterium]